MSITIRYAVESLDLIIDEKESRARKAIAEAQEKHAALEAAETGIIPEGELNCDDALNNGCIRIDGPNGAYLYMRLRTASPAVLKAMCAELTAHKLAAEASGMSAAYAEGGHSLGEWIADINKCLAVHVDSMVARNEAEAADNLVLAAVSDLRDAYSARHNLVTTLPEDVARQMQAEAQMAELWEKYPSTKPADADVKVVSLLRDMPEDIADAYTELFMGAKTVAAASDCYCDCDDCDCDDCADCDCD